jgi:hypothetical protein
MTTVEKLDPSYVIDRWGHKTAVILPIEEYNDLLEDIADLAVVAERIDEPNIPHELVLKEWKLYDTIYRH